MSSGTKAAPDRRVQKTQQLLRDALVALMHEKNYDSIVVKEILNRANVGRSTFYTHFRDKDDLLVSGIHDRLLLMPPAGRMAPRTPAERLIWFSLPIFEYHAQHRRTGGAGMGVQGRVVIHEHLRRVLVELIIDDDVMRRSRRKKTPGVPPVVLARYIASSFILVLNWWIESRSPLAADEVNAVFRALVLPTLATVWE
jgi:AcrR family transcriptional regulator